MPLHLNWSSIDTSWNFRCFWQLTEMAVWLPSYILLIGSRWGPFATEAHQVQHQAKSMSRKRTVPRQTKTGEKCKFWRCKVRETRRDRHSTLRQGRYDLLEDRHRLRRTKRALETWALFLWQLIPNLVVEISDSQLESSFRKSFHLVPGLARADPKDEVGMSPALQKESFLVHSSVHYSRDAHA